VDIVQADTEVITFSTRTRTMPLPNDPLEVVGLSFRIFHCPFPDPGLYWVRFVYNDTVIAQQSLLLR
jgi:hypothetical protein